MKSLLLAFGCTLFTVPAWASPPSDAQALQLASDRGCMACHQVVAGPAPANGQPVAGPAWHDIAVRYKSVKGAQQTLTAKILTGSSPVQGRSTAYASHWGGRVEGDFMPSHRTAISEVEAAQLVAWILAQEIND